MKKKLKYIYLLVESCKEYEGNHYLLDSLHFKVSTKRSNDFDPLRDYFIHNKDKILSLLCTK